VHQWLTPVILATHQEDHSSKPAWGNSSQDTIWKKPITERAGRVAQGEGPEFKPQYRKKQNKQTKKTKLTLEYSSFLTFGRK
jgi:hypothetical protein